MSAGQLSILDLLEQTDRLSVAPKTSLVEDLEEMLQTSVARNPEDLQKVGVWRESRNFFLAW
jgi:hypothetical protein